MIIDHVIVESLMAWARLQAPLAENCIGAGGLIRRRVRLEFFSTEGIPATDFAPEYNRVICRVFLAFDPEISIIDLATPLAETQVG